MLDVSDVNFFDSLCLSACWSSAKKTVALGGLVDVMGLCPVSLETFLCIKSLKNINHPSEGKTLKSSKLSKSFFISELLCSSLMD